MESTRKQAEVRI